MTTEFIVCPLCLKIIHRHDAHPITSRARIPSRSTVGASLLTEMMMDVDRKYRERIQATEEACRSHYINQHPLRFRLWRRFHWNRLMNQRWILWGAPSSEELFNYSQGE